MFQYFPWSSITLDKGADVKGAIADMQWTMGFTMMLLLLAAIGVAYLIPHEPGPHPSDPGRRRRYFWLFCTILPTGLFTGYIVGNGGLITKASLLSNYYQMTGITAAVCTLGAVAIGFVLSKTIMRKGKFGDVFGKKTI